MIHAACSNSNHLETRRKPDADKGWRNQCRLSTATLLIPSVFQSEHLGYPEGRLLLFLGLFCLLGLPGEVKWDGAVCAAESWAWGAGRSDRLPPLPVLPSPRSPQCFRHTWRSSGCHLQGGSGFSVASTRQSWNLNVWLTYSR